MSINHGGRIHSLLWQQHLCLGSIITVFMVALSVGYLLGGQLSLVKPNLARYGLFSFIAAAFTAIPTITFGEKLDGLGIERVEDPVRITSGCYDSLFHSDGYPRDVSHPIRSGY